MVDILCYIIVFGIFAVFAAMIGFCFYNSKKLHQAQKVIREKYNPIYVNNLKHIDGLPIVSGAIVKVCYCEDRMVFIKDNQECTISRDKITSIDCVTGKDIKSKQISGAATGKFLFGGILGAVIGSLIATTTYLVNSYNSNGENKSVVLDTYASGMFALKVQKDFKHKESGEIESIEL